MNKCELLLTLLILTPVFLVVAAIICGVLIKELYERVASLEKKVGYAGGAGPFGIFSASGLFKRFETLENHLNIEFKSKDNVVEKYVKKSKKN